MNISSYETLKKCLLYYRKITVLANHTGICKTTLNRIARGRGKYNGTTSTRLRLEAFLDKTEKMHKSDVYPVA